MALHRLEAPAGTFQREEAGHGPNTEENTEYMLNGNSYLV